MSVGTSTTTMRGADGSSIAEYLTNGGASTGTEMEIGMSLAEGASHYLQDEPDKAIFTHINGTAARRRGITELTAAEFIDRANGNWDQILPDGTRRIQTANNNGYRITKDKAAVEQIAQTLQTNLGITPTEARLRAAKLPETRIKTVTPKNDGAVESNLNIIQTLTYDYRQTGMSAKAAGRAASADAKRLIPVIVDQTLVSTPQLNNKKVDILTQHFVETMGMSQSDAKAAALIDERSFDTDVSRYERDQDAYQRILDGYTARGMDAVKAQKLAYWHPDVVTAKYVPPDDSAGKLQWKPDKTLVYAMATQLMSEDKHLERVKQRASEIMADPQQYAAHFARAALVAEITASSKWKGAVRKRTSELIAEHGSSNRGDLAVRAKNEITSQYLNSSFWSKRLPALVNEFSKRDITAEQAEALAATLIPKVTREQATLEAEQDPRVLVRTKQETVRSPGIDFYLSVSKDVDVFRIWANENGHADLVAAMDKMFMERVVPEVVKVVERDALVTRVAYKKQSELPEGQRNSRSGSKPKRVTADLMVASVLQYTSRATQETIDRGYIADPHMHAHNFVFKTCEREDPDNPGTYKTYTIDEAGFMWQAEARANVASNAMAQVLRELGVRLDYYADKKGRMQWRIHGVSDEAIKYFSSGSVKAVKTIAALEAKLGRQLSGAERRQATRADRFAKTKDQKYIDSNFTTRMHYNAALVDGINLGDFSRTLNCDVELKSLDERKQLLVEALSGTEGLCRDEPTVAKKDLFNHVSRCNGRLGDQALTTEELLEFRDVYYQQLIEIKTDEGEITYTCREQIDRELALDNAILLRQNIRMQMPSPTAVRNALESVTDSDGNSIRLTEEGKNAVLSMVSGANVTVLEAEAGTGKTTALKPAVAALMTKDGKNPAPYNRLFVLAVSSDRANNTGMDLRPVFKGVQPMSIEGLATRLEHGAKPLDEHTVVIIDEAAFVDTARARALFGDPANGDLGMLGKAKVILIGDSEQLTPVGSSGWWERVGRYLPVDTLTKVFRQKDERDSDAYRKIRVGDSVAALDYLEQRGRLHVAEDKLSRIAEIMKVYAKIRSDGVAADDVRVLFDSSNQEVDTANRFIQRYKIQHGELSEECLNVESGSEPGRQWSLHEKESVVFLKKFMSDKGHIRNGTRGVIRSIDEDTRTATVYIPSIDNEVIVEIPEREFNPVLGIADAQHEARFQGSQVKYVVYGVGSPEQTNRNAAYSTATRSTLETHIVTDAETYAAPTMTAMKERIAKAWSASAKHLAAASQLERTDPVAYERIANRKAELPSYEEARRISLALRRTQYVEAMIRGGVSEGLVETITSAEGWHKLDAVLQRSGLDHLQRCQLLVDAITRQKMPPRIKTDAAEIILARITKTHSVAPEHANRDRLSTLMRDRNQNRSGDDTVDITQPQGDVEAQPHRRGRRFPDRELGFGFSSMQ